LYEVIFDTNLLQICLGSGGCKRSVLLLESTTLRREIPVSNTVWSTRSGLNSGNSTGTKDDRIITDDFHADVDVGNRGGRINALGDLDSEEIRPSHRALF